MSIIHEAEKIVEQEKLYMLDQERLLHSFQKQFAARARQSGLLQRLDKVYPLMQPEWPEETRAVPRLIQQQTKSGESLILFSLQFICGDYRTPSMSVAQEFRGELLPVDAFETQDVQEVVGMVETLVEAKKKGQLPYLSDTAAEIK